MDAFDIYAIERPLPPSQSVSAKKLLKSRKNTLASRKFSLPVLDRFTEYDHMQGGQRRNSNSFQSLNRSSVPNSQLPSHIYD